MQNRHKILNVSVYAKYTAYTETTSKFACKKYFDVLAMF